MMGAGGGYSLQMSSAAQSALADRSPINIAPIGFNLGAILQPVAQGGPENGGIGADFMSRYSGQSAGTKSAADIRSSNLLPILMIGGAGLLALLFFMR